MSFIENINMMQNYSDMELYAKYTYENFENNIPIGVSMKLLHIPKYQKGLAYIADLFYCKDRLTSAYLTIVYGKDVPEHTEYYMNKQRKKLLEDPAYIRSNYMISGVLKNQSFEEAFSWDDVYLKTFKKPADKNTNVYIMTVSEWDKMNYVTLWKNAYRSYQDAEMAFYKWRNEFVTVHDIKKYDYVIEQMEVN